MGKVRPLQFDAQVAKAALENTKEDIEVHGSAMLI